VDFICFLLSESDVAFFHISGNDRYLCEEWKERHPNSLGDSSSKFLKMKLVPLKVSFLQTNLTNSVELFIDFCFSFPFFFQLPRQANDYDCGLFLLHFAKLFLEEAPIEFNPSKAINSKFVSDFVLDYNMNQCDL
jgi:sentrin-specific protease 7